MKKVFMLMLVLAVLLVASLAGCGEPDSTESANATVAVDVSQLRNRGEITISNGGDSIHERDVVDYVDGDPADLYDGSGWDVIGIYSMQPQGSDEVENRAILKSGDIVTIDTTLRLLPRKNSSFILNGEAKDEYKIILSLSLDNDGYQMSVVRPGKSTMFINHVSDAWKAHDTIYWMVGDTVYSLNWWDEDESAVYYEGAVGVSHCSDEAEGALVPLEEANYAAYGRKDIFSPYGDK